MSKPTIKGWSIGQALEIIDNLLNSSCNVRGPIFIDEADIRAACPGVPRKIVTLILDGVLSHSVAGANLKLSRPTDAPIPEDPSFRDVDHDFFLRPLLKSSGRRFILYKKKARGYHEYKQGH
jgi:hypothetical protein